MTVRSILEQKGHEVVTIGPEESLGAAIGLLAGRRIGALVVVRPDGTIAGILSERDIVRTIDRSGPEAVRQDVASAMTARVSVCSEDHTVHEVMEIMTRGRFRHLPVEKDGRLVGIVSIGDVVKRRIEDVEREAEEIRTYIATA